MQLFSKQLGITNIKSIQSHPQTDDFSLFELLYGWEVQGPLDLLRKGWETPSLTDRSDKGIVQFVLKMRERLGRYHEEVEVNLHESQKSHKTWHDKQACKRQIEPSQKLLLLIPLSNSKLLAK